MDKEQLELIISIALFLADHCGFTTELQAKYNAKAELIMSQLINHPEDYKEFLEGLRGKYDKLLDEEKEKLTRDE